MSQIKEHCPVCGMDITDDEYLMHEYHGMYYHFCSEQCRDTFTARPTLYMKKTTGNIPVRLKKRKIQLESNINEDKVKALTDAINQLMGIRDIRIEGSTIYLTYDLVQVTLLQIEKIINENGLSMDKGWLSRFKRNWVVNSEQNELDNLALPLGPCCNRAPTKR